MSAKVLIVDDEPAQLELLRYNLEKAGFLVFQCQNGAEALEQITTLAPDLLVIDWMMPEASGIDVCRALRARADTKTIPIIMLSARGEESDRTLGLDIGADDYITKPFSPREFVSRVKALLRRSRPTLSDEILTVEDLALNPLTMQVRRGDKNIHLGPKEYHLLALMMESPERVFSREQLLDRVWGHGIYVEDRTVDVHMSRLRRALKAADAQGPKTVVIRTVRGTGYALSRAEK